MCQLMHHHIIDQMRRKHEQVPAIPDIPETVARSPSLSGAPNGNLAIRGLHSCCPLLGTICQDEPGLPFIPFFKILTFSLAFSLRRKKQLFVQFDSFALPKNDGYLSAQKKQHLSFNQYIGKVEFDGVFQSLTHPGYPPSFGINNLLYGTKRGF